VSPPSASLERRVPRLPLALLLGTTLLFHATTVPQPTGDTRHALTTASQIAHRGRIDLPETAHDGGNRMHEGRSFDFFPWGVAALTAPLVPLLDALTGFDDAASPERVRAEQRAQTVAASIFTMLATCMVVLLLFERERRADVALAAGACFAFATPAWGVAAGALWMHGPVMLLIATLAWGLVRARRDPEVVPHLGWLVVLAFCVRPTTAPLLALVALHVGLRYPGQRLGFAGWLVAAAVPAAWVNLDAFGSILHPYVGRTDDVGLHAQLGLALVGHWISAGRGLLVFSPVLAFAFLGAREKGSLRELHLLFGIVIVAHWLSISSFVHWTGGHSAGPRLFSDVTPLFVWFLGPVLRALLDRRASRGLAVSFALALAVSVLAQARTAYDPAVWLWNASPLDIDAPDSAQRHFDYTDVQFMRMSPP
jgi:hypothetical protein